MLSGFLRFPYKEKIHTLRKHRSQIWKSITFAQSMHSITQISTSFAAGRVFVKLLIRSSVNSTLELTAALNLTLARVLLVTAVS